ncbi:flagellar motor protein MotA [Candidatus Magnetomorum sp. HK-1]|nr:flagellar motor protein MotA [Candidatus Magnetomorum sp. HK-1]
MFSTDADVIHMVTNAGPMVKFVLLLLLFFSVTSWGIIIIKFLYIRRAYKDSVAFVDSFWKSRDLANAFTGTKQYQTCPVGRVFRIGYQELTKLEKSGVHLTQDSDEQSGEKFERRTTGMDNIKRALRRAINTEMTRVTSLTSFLATTGNTAPFVGLFGTVWGIMNSFHSIGLKGSANLAAVAPGISEALIATAAGLAVAIPSVVAFNYFNSKIRVVESELMSFSADFLNIVEMEMLRGKGN